MAVRMLMLWTILQVLLMSRLNGASAACPADVIKSMQFALEYALWRGWHQTVVFDEGLEDDCRPRSVVRFSKCLSVNGVASTTASGGGGPELARSLRVTSRLGLLLLAPHFLAPHPNTTHTFLSTMNKLFDLSTNTESYDWLIIARSSDDLKYLNNILKALHLRFDQHFVVAYPNFGNIEAVRGRVLCEGNFIQAKQKYFHNNKNNRDFHSRLPECSQHQVGRTSRVCWRNYARRSETNYYKSSVRFSNLTVNTNYLFDSKILPLRYSGLLFFNYSRRFDMQNVSEFSLLKFERGGSGGHRQADGAVRMQVVQYFKVRSNSTLYASLLGVWSESKSMSEVLAPYPVESRSFLGEELVVGQLRAGGSGPEGTEERPSASGPADDEYVTDSALMEDMIDFLTKRINATSAVRYFSKLGFRSYEGAWSGLLGALVDRSLDIVLEPVTAHPSRNRDMDFVFPIAQSMRNIYIRQQETSAVRDIFLAPFSPRLIVCVVAMILALAAAMVVVSRFLRPFRAVRTSNNPQRAMSCVEAMIWTTGIMCQQGGTWMPRGAAARILLVSCLLFGLVIYNSYAAFITSVLSVRAASVDTVAAVLHSPLFQIGYIRNGADQMYLMSTKDVDLNKYYIRGYSDSKNLVASAEEGLARAARQDYAFFASQRAARATLRALSQARGRCRVRELPVPSTLAQVAFPLALRSPYAKPTLVSLLSLRGGGVLSRLGAALVPSMPRCAPPPGFASARPTDVRSAMILLALGGAASVALGVGEYCWKNRQRLRAFVKAECVERLMHLLR